LKENVFEPVVKKEGAGAEVKRLFPSSSLDHIDPFVLLDEFFVEADKGFPKHRHAGFEAVTYILEGGFRHEDDMGNDSVVGEGGVQKFSAGSGIRHSEMPAGEKDAHGFQLWINLPKEKKDMEPNYQKVEFEDVPKIKRDNTVIRTIIGEGSPVKVETDVKYQDLSLKRACFTSIDIPEDHEGLLYLYNGEIVIEQGENKLSLTEGEAYVPSGERFSIGCTEDSNFIMVSGKPHHQEIRLEGSIVR